MPYRAFSSSVSESMIPCCAARGRVCRIRMTRSCRRCTADRAPSPGVGWTCGTTPRTSSVPPSWWPASTWACSAAIVASSFSSDMPIGPMREPFRNCFTTGSSLVRSTSRGPNITSSRRNSMPMLSGTVRARLMLCDTMRMVASIWVFRSISSWEM